MGHRRVRGTKDLSKYLKSVGSPMSETTIYKLLREKRIPHIRPSERVLLFNLDSIDRWLERIIQNRIMRLNVQEKVCATR